MILSIQTKSKILVFFGIFVLQFVLAFFASETASQHLEFIGVIVGSFIYFGGFGLLFLGLRKTLFQVESAGVINPSSWLLGVRLPYFFVCFFISIIVVKIPLLSLVFGLIQAKISALVGVFLFESLSKKG